MVCRAVFCEVCKLGSFIGEDHMLFEDPAPHFICSICNQPERLNPETQMVGCKFRGPVGYGGNVLPVRCDSLNSVEIQREKSEEVSPPSKDGHEK